LEKTITPQDVLRLLQHSNVLTQILSEAFLRWSDNLRVNTDPLKNICYIECKADVLADICEWLFARWRFIFAALVIEEEELTWHLRYIFYANQWTGQIHILCDQSKKSGHVPSIGGVVFAAALHEKEAEQLFGIPFDRSGVQRNTYENLLSSCKNQENSEKPVEFSHLEPTQYVGIVSENTADDTVKPILDPVSKYRGVERIAEGKSISDALLLAERFSGTSAFAHSLAFCQAVEEISGIELPRRAKALRILIAEMERLRHHVNTIRNICLSATAEPARNSLGMIEEALLRLSCSLTGHRYFFGLNIPGGLTMDFSTEFILMKVSGLAYDICRDLRRVRLMLRFIEGFADHLKTVGIISFAEATSFGLVGPAARASGVSNDLRKALPYSDYEKRTDFLVPVATEGDNYARLRILFDEADQATDIIQQMAMSLPTGSVVCPSFKIVGGSSFGWVEAPGGATFHWLRCDESGYVKCYRTTTPSSRNWCALQLAKKSTVPEDFPATLATFGLSRAERDR